MRTVLIDFNESVPCKQTIIGYVGEHNATEIIVTPPDILASNEAVTRYIIAFVTGGKIIHSEPFNKAETLAVKLWKQLTLETVMGIQLEAYDDNQNFVGKSEFISGLRFLPSACGDDTVADTDNPDIVSAIAANTSARHTHTNIETLDKLGETNGNLTYKGREVGSGGSGDLGGKEEIYIGSGEMPEGYVLQIDPEGTADTIPTKTSQLVNDSGFITVKDLPNPELPSVTEADNGKVLRVVNGVWAADTIPDNSEQVIAELESMIDESGVLAE